MSDQDSIPPNGFRLIPGFPRYAINEHGTILSVCVRGSIAGTIRPWSDARQLNPSTVRGGYQYVSIGLVHVLVLTTFVGPRPDGMECRHLDGNPKNNTIDNLAWGTPKQNKADKILHGTTNRGERSGHAKLTEADILEIRARAANGERQVDIAKDFPIHPYGISGIVQRRTWKHV